LRVGAVISVAVAKTSEATLPPQRAILENRVAKRKRLTILFCICLSFKNTSKEMLNY
jgi:hypothetical protein